MKTLIKITVIAVLAVLLSLNSKAQMHDHSKMDMSKTSTNSKIDITTAKTETIKVLGECDMCKARIEKAAKISGVTKAEWSEKAKTLTTTFDPAKTSIDAIGKKIAEAGYDNDKAKATDVAYNKLPSCCQYERKK